MPTGCKTKILLGDEAFELRWIPGRIRRGGRELAYYVDQGRGVVELSNLLTRQQAVEVMAALASDYCQRRWRAIEVVAGRWWEEEEKAGG
jgi:hypothetical protein